MPVSPSPSALSSQSLAGIDASVVVPSYDRSTLRPAIVHVGVGGFHRAHLATYVDELCARGETEWAIAGAGVLSSDGAMAEVLRAQDHLYSLITRGPETVDVRVIGSIIDYIHAAATPQALVRAIASPSTQIVSLTVTEGGYPVDDLDGGFRPGSPNAAADSAFGLLATALDRRRSAGQSGLTVLSCDNVIGNGAVTRTATLGVAEAVDPTLAEWIARNVSFPNSMVDRITPATTEADRRWLADTHGIVDGWPVATEPFRQWVVEDTFAGDRMPFDRLDVITTSDVEPYELMKLRLLNSGHSCLAYLAALDGLETVDAAMATSHLRSFLQAVLRLEAQPVLPPIAGIDVDAYITSLMERFSNPSIGDQISRLCLDGTAKFPKFLLPTVRGQLAAGGPIRLAALALAGWCEYLTRPAETLANDPRLDDARAHAARSISEPAAFLSFREVFGDDLITAEPFVDAFEDALRHLRERGVRSAIEDALSEGLHLDGRQAQ